VSKSFRRGVAMTTSPSARLEEIQLTDGIFAPHRRRHDGEAHPSESRTTDVELPTIGSIASWSLFFKRPEPAGSA
jgi:hypothetical protein